jgi:capsular exopolysaccharide synthesis family protein
MGEETLSAMLPLDPPPEAQPNGRPVPEHPAVTARPVVGAVHQAGAPPALLAPPGLEAFTRAFTHRLKLVVIFGSLALTIGAAAGWLLTPHRYVGEGYIRLSAKSNRDSSNEEFLNFQRTQITILHSETILRRLLDVPDIRDLSEVMAHGDQDDAINWLRKDLLVEPVLGNPEVLRLTLSGRHPEDLARILNKLMDIYVQDNRLKEQGVLSARIKQHQEKYDANENDLADLRRQLRQLEIDNGLEDQKTIPDRIQRLETERFPFTLQLFQLEVDLTKCVLAIKGYQNALSNPNEIPVSETAIQRELNPDKGYQTLKDERTRIEQQMFQALKVAPEATRQGIFEEYQRQLKVIDFQLGPLYERARKALVQDEVDKIKKNLADAQVTQTVLQQQMAKLSAKIDPLTREIESLRDKLRGPGRMIPKIEAVRDRVKAREDDQAERNKELNGLKRDLDAAGRAEKLEDTRPPVDQKLDKKFKVAGMTGFSLFGLTVLGIAFAEYRTRRVYTPEDVTRGLGIPMVGALPAIPLNALQALPAADGAYMTTQAPLLESVDALRTVMLRAAKTDGVRVVMVTSAGGGEGKSSLAAHLAASLARGWRNTLLLEADLRNPSTGAPFDLPRDAPGLSEVLRGEVTTDVAIRPTALPRLALLPAGRADAGALRALAQEQVGTLIGRLKSGYDFVVVDVPPVLPVPDALMIGQHADAVILAVLRNVSRLPAVYAAQQRLAALDIPMLGAVVIGESAKAYGIKPYPLKLHG